MRVTNGMIINTTLNGLYSNMNSLNKTYAQMVTGKKIQTVSDDPIIAGRTLKLTTTVLENKQYSSNVKEATSWADVTNTGLDNINSVLKKVRELCVQGSTGTLNKENKEAIKTQIEQLWKQIQEESNNSYGGRYVFTGYKTNQPMCLTQDYKVDNGDWNVKCDSWLGSTSEIAKGTELAAGTQISGGSVLGETTEITGEFTLGIGTKVSETDLKQILGYSSTVDGKYQLDNDKTYEAGTELTVEEVKILEKITDTSILPDEYTDEKFTLTTDVIIPSSTTSPGTKIEPEDFNVLFGVKMINNPEGTTGQYFELTKSAQYSNAGGTYNFSGNVIVGVGCKFTGKIKVGQAATDTGITTKLEAQSVIAAGSKVKENSTIGSGSLNPEVLGNIKGHAIKYEIGVNSTITVNTEGMDQIMIDMSLKFNEIFSVLDNALVDDTVTLSDLHEMFTRKLDEIDDTLNQVSKVSADLGSRMNRLEYTASRLTDQKTIYSNLLSETEDIDIEEVYTNFNVQYATYQSALQATSKIITNTLADYL